MSITEAAPHTISRTLQGQLTQLRDDFQPYLRTWDALTQRRAELAKPFMAAFQRWQQETGRSFIAFVQQIDPGVPAEKARYVNHRTFRAALYLRRLVEAPATVAGRSERQSMTPFNLLATVIKSTLPLVRPHEATMWSAISARSRWHQRDLQRLQARVKRVRPIVLRPDVPRLVVEGRRQVKLASAPMSAAADRAAAS